MAITLFLVALLAAIWGSHKRPIKIGLVTTLTGSSSTSGARYRNGVMLAVEETNQSGGIDGRMIDLVVKDDKGDPETATEVDRQLADEGVVAIIGHYLSNVGVAGAKVADERNVLMISGASITQTLSDKDDNFLRISNEADSYTQITTEIARNRLGCKTMVIAQDLSNTAYTESIRQQFQKRFENTGGTVVDIVTFDPVERFSAPEAAQNICQYKTDGVLIITNGIRAALICQHVRMLDANIKLLPSAWAFADSDFITNGGAAIEGIIAIGGLVAAPDHEGKLNKFVSAFADRFNEECESASVAGYEVAVILTHALSQTRDPKKLKSVILKQGTFDGVESQIRFNRYGDVNRAICIQQIRNGKRVVIETFPSPVENFLDR